jgi:hypothetical protein
VLKSLVTYMKSIISCFTFLMAPRKSKASTKEHVCSDPFIVDDDDSVAGSEDDDYEESVLLFIFIKCSVLTILC